MSFSTARWNWDALRQPTSDPGDVPWENLPDDYDDEANLDFEERPQWTEEECEDPHLRLAPIDYQRVLGDNRLPPLLNTSIHNTFNAPALRNLPPPNNRTPSRPNSSGDQQPPPSNQQALERTSSSRLFHHLPRTPSQLRYNSSPSPDIPLDPTNDADNYLDEFFDFEQPWISSATSTPQSQEMAPTTRGRGNSQRNTEPVVDLTESSPPRAMPSTTRKRNADRETPGEGRAPPKKKIKATVRDTSDLEDIPLVDLVDVDNQKEYEEHKAKAQADLIKAQNQAEATKPVKLAHFQCIICMDSPTDLTVTHCGHLFCGECLHQALHAGERKVCPVCRTSITVVKEGQKSNKGYFPLNMKLMTAKKAGKRSAVN